MPTITVALISPFFRMADVAHNLQHYEALIEKAACQGAEFVAFPECALCGYPADAYLRQTADSVATSLRQTAEPVPGPSVRALEKIARKNNVYLSMGMLEKKADGRNFNVQIVVGPEGFLGRYIKHHPVPEEKEYLATDPGTDFPVFLIKGIRMGINICADNGWRDTIEALAAQGVELVHSPCANGIERGDNAEEWTRNILFEFPERVICSRAHILVNNLSGRVVDSTGKTHSFPGGAMILDPLYQVVARTLEKDCGEKILVATLDTGLEKYIGNRQLNWLRKRMAREPNSILPRIRSML